MSRRDQLQHLIDTRAGGNQAVFAPMIHRKPTVVWQYLSGYREMGEKFARHIEQCLHLPHGWMDLPSTANLPTTTELQPIAPGPEFVAIERVNLKVSAGVTGFAIEHHNGNGPPIFFRADWLQAEGLRAERLFALRVSGDSMEPALWDGDLVVINTAATAPKDGVAFVINYEGEVLIKRLERDAGDWWLTSDNQRYKRKRCDEHAILIGRVIYKQSGRI